MASSWMEGEKTCLWRCTRPERRAEEAHSGNMVHGVTCRGAWSGWLRADGGHSIHFGERHKSRAPDAPRIGRTARHELMPPSWIGSYFAVPFRLQHNFASSKFAMTNFNTLHYSDTTADFSFPIFLLFCFLSLGGSPSLPMRTSSTLCLAHRRRAADQGVSLSITGIYWRSTICCL